MIWALALLTFPTAIPAAQAPPPTADELVTQAWTLLPTYDGATHPALPCDQRSRAEAGAHLLEAAVALAPDHVRALWSLGHAETLLAEDARDRLEEESAEVSLQAAKSAFARAIDIAPDDPWSWYSRGVLRTSFGDHTAAVGDLERALSACTEQLDTLADTSQAEWLRFKILELRCEVLVRAGEVERARDALKAFHTEFSNNEWPLHIALADCALRAGDLNAARSAYGDAVAAFPNDYQAYSLLGYLAGLAGDREEATKQLVEALDRELAPGMYTRLWLWILATEERRVSAREDLAGLLANPPDTLSTWDLTLGRFALGEGTPDAFLEAARAERQRRLDGGEALDDLMCEAWFYAGLRHEEDGEVEAARSAYERSVAYAPVTWKWEWAFSRSRLAELR